MATNRAETAAAYAALILADAEVAITAEKIQTLIRAAGIEDIEPIWATLFAKALEGKDVKDLILRVGAAPGGTKQEVGGGEDGAKEKVDEDKKGDNGGSGDDHEDGSDDEDIGMGLFDF